MRVLLAIVATLLVVWAVDDASLRWNVPKREQFGSVMVRKYYAVALKNRKTEYMFEPPQPERCVNSLLPHFGSSPCWYLTRHPRQRVDIGSTPSDFWRLP